MSKRENIIKAASRLFAEQGFEATTTLQLTMEAGATEPLLYYHFKGKDDLFTTILSSTFDEYFSRLESLNNNTPTEFEKIDKLITMHLDIVEDMPDEIYLAVSTCPAKLKDPEHVCHRYIRTMRRRFKAHLTACLETGIAEEEFHPVPVDSTVNLLMAMIIGLLRQRGLRLEDVKGMKETAVEFCRRSLVKN